MATGTGRQAYLDRVRGFAVLVMIEAHVLDSWTRLADRHSTAYRYAIILGGFGAPLFLFLAGVTFVLSAESKYRKTGDFEGSWGAVQKRGWQIFALAFVFRLQSFILTGAHNLMGLLNVDILNVMGPALVFTGFIGSRSNTRFGRPLVLALLTACAAMLTPIVRATPLLNWLPEPIQWYFRASPTRSNFTLFPWAAFVWAGAVVGEVIDGLRSADRTLRVQMALAAASIVVIVASYGASLLPSIYPASDFWTSSPTFFFLRVGLISLLLPLMFLWDRAPWRGAISQWSPIEELGRASLFVYWIHVEMVYGFISRPLRRNLSFPAAIVAYALFSAFILALVLLKNRLVTIRKAGSLSTTGPTPAPI